MYISFSEMRLGGMHKVLDLYELKQLIAFAECGTLAKVAEQFHISTPSITRAMQHVEESFGVPLFVRGKNRIELNENGKLAVEHGRKLLAEAEQTVQAVRAFDQRQRTIVVRSCAPAPLWELLRYLSASYPGCMIESAICQNEEVLSAWRDGTCDVAVLPFMPEREQAKKFMEENLYICVPPEHALAGAESVTFADINGYNFLLRSELGFWDTMCREQMPASKFLVQTDEFTFNELVRSSSLPSFTTDYVHKDERTYENRIHIPIADAAAHVMFYVLVSDRIR